MGVEKKKEDIVKRRKKQIRKKRFTVDFEYIQGFGFINVEVSPTGSLNEIYISNIKINENICTFDISFYPYCNYKQLLNPVKALSENAYTLNKKDIKNLEHEFIILDLMEFIPEGIFNGIVFGGKLRRPVRTFGLRRKKKKREIINKSISIGYLKKNDQFEYRMLPLDHGLKVFFKLSPKVGPNNPEDEDINNDGGTSGTGPRRSL